MKNYNGYKWLYFKEKMMAYLLEEFLNCPNCNAEISVLIDPSVPTQEYIEDCEVCCHPLQISYSFREGVLESFSAELVEQ